MSCGVLQCGAVWCSVVQCVRVAICCSLLQFVAVCMHVYAKVHRWKGSAEWRVGGGGGEGEQDGGLWWGQVYGNPLVGQLASIYEMLRNFPLRFGSTYTRISTTQRQQIMYTSIRVECSGPEASWRRVFNPWTPLLFDLCHYLEQNGSF